jgi:hypothetical protein
MGDGLPSRRVRNELARDGGLTPGHDAGVQACPKADELAAMLDIDISHSVTVRK